MRALLEYDDGGKTRIDVLADGRKKMVYEPSGNVVTKWRDLHSVGYLMNEVFFLKGEDWSRAVRTDFSRNAFDRLARNKQLASGESILGWGLFELDEDIRPQVPIIKELETEIVNSFGEKQILRPPLLTLLVKRALGISTSSPESMISRTCLLTWHRWWMSERCFEREDLRSSQHQLLLVQRDSRRADCDVTV